MDNISLYVIFILEYLDWWRVSQVSDLNFLPYNTFVSHKPQGP